MKILCLEIEVLQNFARKIKIELKVVILNPRKISAVHSCFRGNYHCSELFQRKSALFSAALAALKN